MKKLLLKEFKLSMHPTVPLFILLSAMVFIPNYPYYVIFFYTTLAFFFVCLTGRENKDVAYTMLLPVKKSDVVKARFVFLIIVEMLQIIVAVPFAFIRQNVGLEPNAVGMEANIALFGFAFLIYGIFHLAFFGIYYKDVKKVGKAFIASSIALFLFICIAETLVHIIPFLRDKIDTYDNVYIPEKLIVLAAGIVIYIICTVVAYKKAINNFEKQDI